MNVVLYMRYSSDRQTEQSIEGQRRVCHEFCKRKDFHIVKEYVDRATSAFKDTDKRVSFNEMIKDSEKQMWDVVVVYKLDRFARNRYDSAVYKAKLKKNGVRVISATENISDEPEGVILEAVLEGMAEFYSKELSQKISRGLYESASKGCVIGGQIPLGYRSENKKFVIDPAGAKIVQEAFQLYSEGRSIQEMCSIFDKKGYRTAKGARFNKNSFTSMLRNERYLGIYKYKDIVIEGGIPQIVSKEQFDMVAHRLAKTATAPARGKAKVEYLLSQKLFCGHCGAPMQGDSGTSHTGVVHNYYTCGTKKRFHSCDKKSLQKDFIERAVLEDIQALINPDMIETLADMAISANMRDIKNNTVVPVLENELQEVERKIANLLKAMEKGAISETLTNRITELEAQKKDIKHRLIAAKDEIIILERPHVVWWLSKFCEGDLDDQDYCRKLIDLFVNSVTVYDEPDGYKITTMYNLTENNTQTFRISKESSSDLNGQLPP